MGPKAMAEDFDIDRAGVARQRMNADLLTLAVAGVCDPGRKGIVGRSPTLRPNQRRPRQPLGCGTPPELEAVSAGAPRENLAEIDVPDREHPRFSRETVEEPLERRLV